MSDYIPPEVVNDILVKLPVKSIVRFRCVCKDWFSLISSSSFLAKHLSLSSSSSHSKTLVRHYSKTLRKEIYQVFNEKNFNIENNNITRFKFPTQEDSGYYNRVVGSCNGLLCLSDDLFGYREDSIILWNPSIKRALTLPTPRVIYDRVGPYTFSLGFGFDSITSDYKVIRVSYLSPNFERHNVIPPKVEVFSLSIGTWRSIKNNVVSCIVDHFYSQVFLNGAIHWPAYKTTSEMNKYGKPFCNVLLKFDLNSEEFVEWSLPEDLACEHPTNLLVTTINSNFCVLSNDAFTKETITDLEGSCDIWVMTVYGNMESWIPVLHISLDTGLWMMSGFKEHSELAFSTERGELAFYDFEKKALTGTGIRGTKYSFFVDMFVESLVLMDKGKEVQETTEPEPHYEDEDEKVEKEEYRSRMFFSWAITVSCSNA